MGTGVGQQITSIGRARPGEIAKGDLFQTQTYPVENAILEIDLDASRNVLDLFTVIDLGEVDANL